MRLIPAKSILSAYAPDNPWFGVHYNMNIYKGCNHGCIYCDSRSQCYGVEDFDEVRAKSDALALIDRELQGKRRSGVVGTGAMSDPYNPLEREHELTRGALKLIRRYGFGISIATKSALVTRDIDVLQAIHRHSPVVVMLTVTTADDRLAHILEPGASPPSERFGALRALADSGIPCGILMMPVLPFIEDTLENVADILEKGHGAGARYVCAGFGVTLRQNQREWFYQKLDAHFPGLRQRYIRQYGEAYSCPSPNAPELKRLLKRICRETGMKHHMKAIIADYTAGYGSQQLSFL